MRRLPLAALALALALVPAAAARAGGAAEAEALVRALYFEGLPADAARALDDVGIARLGEMLADPGELAHHGNIVSALGLSGHPAAFALLRAYAADAPRGEVDRATFRARTRLGWAFGQLARSDGRAVAWLLAAADVDQTPLWSHRHHRGARLRALLEEQILTGLALSGAPAARPLLDAAAARPGDDTAAERRRRHGRWALAQHAREAAGRSGDAR